jgi:hypothetical protein
MSHHRRVSDQQSRVKLHPRLWIRQRLFSCESFSRRSVARHRSPRAAGHWLSALQAMLWQPRISQEMLRGSRSMSWLHGRRCAQLRANRLVGSFPKAVSAFRFSCSVRTRGPQPNWAQELRGDTWHQDGSGLGCVHWPNINLELSSLLHSWSDSQNTAIVPHYTACSQAVWQQVTDKWDCSDILLTKHWEAHTVLHKLQAKH